MIVLSASALVHRGFGADLDLDHAPHPQGCCRSASDHVSFYFAAIYSDIRDWSRADRYDLMFLYETGRHGLRGLTNLRGLTKLCRENGPRYRWRGARSMRTPK